jgi:hypothetical protein
MILQKPPLPCLLEKPYTKDVLQNHEDHQLDDIRGLNCTKKAIQGVTPE